jgi:hypothetical protein
MLRHNALKLALVFGFIGALTGSIARAEQAAPAANYEELKRQIDVLGQEIQKLKIGDAAQEATADRVEFGYGPGISKVYRSKPGFSLGGYGEVLFQSFADGFDSPAKRPAPGSDFDPNAGQKQFDLSRAVIYLGYKFNDQWIVNSEFEFEHGGDEIGVEFLYTDYFWSPSANLRVGKVLLPMGLTNEIHEPTTYLGTHRPLVETLIIPTTWSQYGLGVFGDVGPFTYRVYGVNGLNASGFAADNGVREGRAEAGPSNATVYAGVARLDYTGTPGLLAGGSLFLGESSTTPAAGFDPLSVPTRIFEVHVQYNYRALDLRTVAAYSTFSNVDSLDARSGLAPTDSIGSRQGGVYFQAGYDVFSLLNFGNQSLMPFVRWEFVDTQLEVPPGYIKNGANQVRTTVVGLNYKPISQLVFKGDYQWYSLGDGNGVNQWNLSLGYVF